MAEPTKKEEEGKRVPGLLYIYINLKDTGGIYNLTKQNNRGSPNFLTCLSTEKEPKIQRIVIENHSQNTKGRRVAIFTQI